MKALHGIRLLDLTHMLSGPYAGMILADMGAETIKIEPPGQGEGTRRLLENDQKHSKQGIGAYFLTLNRNKKSITLNLKSEKGLSIFYQLVERSDIVLDNFSPGVTDRLKISHEYLAKSNPAIITCSITGFGETGPDKNRPSFDLVAQAMGGGMSITGHPESPPTRAGIPIGDLGAGLMSAIGILGAIVARQTTGVGQHVDISMVDTQISLLNYMVTMYFLSGEIPPRWGNGHPVHVPYDTYPCSDGFIILAVITDNFWRNLMDLVDLPELDTEENKKQPGRRKNLETINLKLSELFQGNSQVFWIEKLRGARIPCAPVLDLAQALNTPQSNARNMVVDVSLSEGGSVRLPGNPVKMSHTYEDSFSPPPSLGQHTEEILWDILSINPDEIKMLHQEGII